MSEYNCISSVSGLDGLHAAKYHGRVVTGHCSVGKRLAPGLARQGLRAGQPHASFRVAIALSVRAQLDSLIRLWLLALGKKRTPEARTNSCSLLLAWWIKYILQCNATVSGLRSPVSGLKISIVTWSAILAARPRRSTEICQ